MGYMASTRAIPDAGQRGAQSNVSWPPAPPYLLTIQRGNYACQQLGLHRCGHQRLHITFEPALPTQQNVCPRCPAPGFENRAQESASGRAEGALERNRRVGLVLGESTALLPRDGHRERGCVDAISPSSRAAALPRAEGWGI
eukprot:1944609-Pyramimonas_sp.AAC.1